MIQVSEGPIMVQWRTNFESNHIKTKLRWADIFNISTQGKSNYWRQHRIKSDRLEHGRNGTEYLCRGFSQHPFSFYRCVKLLRWSLGLLKENLSNEHELVDGISCCVRHINRRNFIACVPHRALFGCHKLFSVPHITLGCRQLMRCNLRSIYCYN